MPQPIPSYLLAIAAGDLVFEPSGRSGVWAEPTMVNKAAKEFEDTEKMIGAAEKLYGVPLGPLRHAGAAAVVPVRRHGKPAPDLRHPDRDRRRQVAGLAGRPRTGAQLVGQPGDQRQLEGHLAQRRLHHLRPGRITEALYGKEMAEMEKQIDQTDLLAEVKDMSPADQALALPPLNERDPDEALSQVAYVKGSWFLEFLEQRFGRETFDPFLRAGSMTTPSRARTPTSSSST
jgi:hypothetical protein